MSDQANTVAILLAAGEGRRMGMPKQLMDYEGKSLIDRSIEQILGSGVEKVVVVLGAFKEVLEPMCKAYPVETVVNGEWRSGMGSSIRVGEKAVRKLFPDAEAILICLCDQPLVVSEHYEKLLHAAGENLGKVSAAFYEGQFGAPLIVPKSLFPVLKKAKGDQGIRKWIRSNSKSVVGVEIPEAALDWDEPGDITKKAL